jgi:hypothetical protein
MPHAITLSTNGVRRVIAPAGPGLSVDLLQARRHPTRTCGRPLLRCHDPGRGLGARRSGLCAQCEISPTLACPCVANVSSLVVLAGTQGSLLSNN